MDNKPQQQQQQQQQQEVKDIELVDIEDIVPFGGNSIFLCLARVLIYMSHKNSKFTNALTCCVGLNKTDLISDIHLQNLLRIKLCEYWLKNGIYFDESHKKFLLTNDYSNYFNGNIYDFLIQVYQMNINNFSNNSLYKKYALGSLSKMLKMKIYYKKTNGQWKCHGPSKKTSYDKLLLIDNENIVDLVDYLNNTTIYLQEFKSDSSQTMKESLNNIFLSKNIRFLLDKKLWLSNYHENAKICMKFSQFNDKDELKLYQDPFFQIDSKKILTIFLANSSYLNIYERIFCVFVYKVPVQILIRCLGMSNEQFICNFRDYEFSVEQNTIGKQILKLQTVDLSPDAGLFLKYLNYLWASSANKFNLETVNKYFFKLLNQC